MASLSVIPVRILILALVMQLASTTVAAFRWFLIMRRMGSTANVFFFMKSYFKGTFFNQGLPTSIGGDGILKSKGLVNTREKERPASSCLSASAWSLPASVSGISVLPV